MILEQVIVNRVTIDRPRQVRLFQVRLPRQTQDLTGVATTVRWLIGAPALTGERKTPWELPFEMRGNTPIGDLRLQSADQGNIFYTQEVILNNNNDFGDFASEYLVPNNYNQLKAAIDPVRIGGKATVVFGCYKDQLAESLTLPFRYVLSVYTWIKFTSSNSKP